MQKQSNEKCENKNYSSVSKNDRYLIFYHLKKPEPIFTFLAYNILIILASKSIYNFLPNLMCTYFTLQFFRVAEMTFSKVTATFVNMPFNRKTVF